MRAILAVCMLVGCTSAPGLTLSGEISAGTVSPQPGHKILNVVFDPEQGGHRAYGTLAVEIPSSFVLDVPEQSSGFEERDGLQFMAGSIVTSDDPLGDPDDGFDVPYDETAYTLLYFDHAPTTDRPPFLATDAIAGWNLLVRQPVTCNDAEDLGGGAIGWPAKYKVAPLDTPLEIQLFAPGTEPWEPPFNCP